MAVWESALWPWAERLRDAAEAVHRSAMQLASPTDGPFSAVLPMAASDVWGGPFADQLRAALRSLDAALEPWADHLVRLDTALDQASTELRMAMNAEASGVPSTYDPLAALAPWRRWPAPSLPLPAGWAHAGTGSAGFVWVYPDRARQLASQLRVAAEELRALRRRLAVALAPLVIDAPVGFDLAANATDEVAAEVVRRVEALEEADRRTAGTFATVGEQLGFPGSLAPPADFNRGELRALEQAPAAAGPGRQPTQATESDPVSVATGNFLHEAIDLVLPGRGLSTVFIRTYNSLRADEDGPLGFGWSHTFGAHLRIEDGAVVVCSGDGREERHAWAGTGPLTAPVGAAGRLYVEGDGFVLRSEENASFRFDSSGGLLGLADRSGNETVLAYHDGRLVRVADAAGRVTSFEHDRAGRITALFDCRGGRFEYRYDRRGDLVAMTDPCGRGWSYDYDDEHRLIGITDPEGRVVVRNAYDEGGRVVEQHDGAGNPWTYVYLPGRTRVTDPLGQATSYEHDAGFRTTAVIDPMGAVTRFAWDRADQLVAVVDPAGGRVTLTYDHRGHLVEAAGPGTAPVGFEWDADDNLTAVISAEGDRASFAYDEAGRPVRFSSPAGVETRVAWRPDGLPESVTEGDGGVTRFAYDAAGHLAATTDPLGAVTTIVCDPAGRPVSEVHPGGARTEFGWDAMGRLVSVTEAHGATTTFDYDRSGLLVALIDAVGRTTRYGYEERGLLASVTDPLGRVTTFTYDACGRLASRKDPRGATVSFSYDRAGRLVGIEAPDVAPVSWTWDRAGRLVSVTDGTGVTTFECDEAGRPVAERHDRSGAELLHTYDALGRRRRLELHRGGAAVAAWGHDYDADGASSGSSIRPGGRPRWPTTLPGGCGRYATPTASPPPGATT